FYFGGFCCLLSCFILMLLLPEVEHESGTLWETDVLKGIRDVEQKIFEAKGLGPDGKDSVRKCFVCGFMALLWNSMCVREDMCLLAKPDEQLKGL
ncbi:PTCHD2, partial [Symbiodinium pilosum]